MPSNDQRSNGKPEFEASANQFIDQNKDNFCVHKHKRNYLKWQNSLCFFVFFSKKALFVYWRIPPEGRKDLYCHCMIEIIQRNCTFRRRVDQSCYKLFALPHKGLTWLTYFLIVGENGEIASVCTVTIKTTHFLLLVIFNTEAVRDKVSVLINAAIGHMSCINISIIVFVIVFHLILFLTVNSASALILIIYMLHNLQTDPFWKVLKIEISIFTLFTLCGTNSFNHRDKSSLQNI